MDFTIVRIGDVTSNGNRIVKMQHRVETETVLGTMRQSETYYAAVKAESVKVSEGNTISLDPSQFTVTERPFVNPETGEEIMLKWLSLKR
jgi:hypothetical protein